jgi:hypothetical protein
MRAPRVNPSIWTKLPHGALSDRIGPQCGDVLTTADDTTHLLCRSDQIRPAMLVTSAASSVIKVASIIGISILVDAFDNAFGFV